jgi:hypothetical protein
MRNIWLQNIGFLMLALFSTILLTTPRVTALVLLGFVLVAIVTSLVFERRTFCRYLCPVGGFIGLYSQMAPIELRVKDRQVCADHTEKTCYTGSDDGYGCPWLVFPGSLTTNTYCGLCTECLKTCTRDNIALYVRPPAADLLRDRPATTPPARMDEAYKGLIMLACAMLYSAVLIGPWGVLKDAARSVGSLPWLGYAAGFLAFVLIVLPGLFWLAIRAGSWLESAAGLPGPTAVQPSRRFAEYATALVPLGLASWVAFSLSFVLINFSYAWSVASDPMGWGWNLLGTAGLGWTPYLPGLVPVLQVPVMLVGLSVAVLVTMRTCQQLGHSPRAALPVIGFCTAATLGLLALYLA